MNKPPRDAWSAAFFFCLAVFVSYQGWHLGIGQPSSPGPGFLFFWTGSLLSMLSLIVLGRSFKSPADSSGDADDTNRQTAAAVLIAAVLYVAFMEWLGFVPATFLYAGALLRIGRVAGRARAAAAAFLIALVSYVIFFLLLGVSLPAGLWGLFDF
jgi:hypothetical protein